jgi:hypothetical protein
MDITEVQAVIAAISPLVSDVTSSATWIALLYIAFKLLIELTVPLAVVWIIKKVIDSVREYALKTKVVTVVEELSLSGLLVGTGDDVIKLANELIKSMKTRGGKYPPDGKYIHASDLRWAIDKVNTQGDKQPT